MGALLDAAPQIRPQAEKLLWRTFYELASLRGRDVGSALMNYGYASTDANEPEGGHGEEDLGRQLYATAVGDCELRGRDVLEVGCGRGGGSVFVFDRFAPRSLTGVDVARSAVRRCRRDHGRPGLQFVAADAEALPFAAGTFDAVISVESSHCYPDMARFLGEAQRVLRRDGSLLLTDFRRTAAADPSGGADQLLTLRRQLDDAGLDTVEERDITANVVQALRLRTPGLRARIERSVPRPLRRYAFEFAGLEGSAIYRAFAEGELTYRRLVLRRGRCG